MKKKNVQGESSNLDTFLKEEFIEIKQMKQILCTHLKKLNIAGWMEKLY